jgi:hypothetical protein
VLFYTIHRAAQQRGRRRLARTEDDQRTIAGIARALAEGGQFAGSPDETV